MGTKSIQLSIFLFLTFKSVIIKSLDHQSYILYLVFIYIIFFYYEENISEFLSKTSLFGLLFIGIPFSYFVNIFFIYHNI